MVAFTNADAWRPGIGDPTVMGWLTVAAYFGTALLCLREAVLAIQRSRAREVQIFWSVLTTLLILLGVNKQLDLQTLLTLTGRKLAIAQGWYENRRPVQMVFVTMVAVAGTFGAVAMNRLVRRYPEMRLSLAGFVSLLVFVVVRAASFHHMDQLINFRFWGVRMNWMLELGAIGLVAVGTMRASGTETRNPDEPGGWAAAR